MPFSSFLFYFYFVSFRVSLTRLLDKESKGILRIITESLCRMLDFIFLYRTINESFSSSDMSRSVSGGNSKFKDVILLSKFLLRF